MKSKVIILALLLPMVTVAGWAQNLPGSIWSSPQSSTTEGRYRSNADNFIRPDAYTGVNFNKWFGLVAFRWFDDESATSFSQPLATAGFATKAGSVYIGAFYSGNAWTGAPTNNYIEQELTTAPAGGVTGKVYNVYSGIGVAGTPSPVNNAALLIGVADMGFRLTYRSNHFSFNEDNIVVGNQTSGYQLYKNYKAENGYIAPQIAWAMAKNLSPKGIRPYITVDLVFDRDYEETETVGGTTGVNIDHSLNHFDPKLSAGLGGYTFYNKEGFSGSFDVDYELTLNLYDNEYSYLDNGVYKTGKISGTYSPGSNPYIEEFYISNLLTPSVSGSWSGDRLALRFKLNLPLTLANREQSSMDVDASGKLINRAGTESNSTSTFSFRPDIRFAMQYKVIPDRLTLNAGARIQTTAVLLETVTATYYNASSEKAGTRKLHQDSLGPSTGNNFASRFSFGPTLNFTENFWLEATTGVTNVYGENAIEIFAAGGLFSFGSILAVLKF